MQASSQGISMCTSAGDDGVYDAAREFGLNSGITDAASLSVDSLMIVLSLQQAMVLLFFPLPF
jgi:hypothetical protein